MAPDDDQIGALIASRFRIRSVVGRGGMAVVYAAHDEVLERTVALKIFRTTGESEIFRGSQEMRALASLNHPNLVTLFDANLGSSSLDYLVMELVPGPNLREAIDSRLLESGSQIAAIAFELAEALQAVHAAGIVHRDLKPANVLLIPTTLATRPFRAKLADFGIAHLLGSARVTSVGNVIGTAAYLSPEQLNGELPGTPSDIYSLGLVLLEALGSRESQPRTYAEAVSSRLTFNPVIPSDLPAGWAKLLREMTSRIPAERPTAAQAADSMSAIASELDFWVPPESVESEFAPTQVLSISDAREAATTIAVESPITAEHSARAIPLIGAATVVAVIIAVGFIGLLNIAPSQPGNASVLPPTPTAVATSSTAPVTPVATASPVTAVTQPGNGQPKSHGNGKGHK
jgi:serine/threonine protein kinase